jgi:agmatine deiminase
MIAEWEANGVFLADMLKVRHPALFAQLYATLTSHGVEVRLLENVRDIWARDYCPIQIGPGEFVKFRYESNYLKENSELRTGRDVAEQFRELGACRYCALNLDGGNVVASRNKAILTDKIYRENPDWERSKLRDELRRVLQVEKLIVVPKEPSDQFGHSDSLVRFINESTVLVNDYSGIDQPFGNRLAKALWRHGLSTELIPYCPEQQSTAGIESAVGCYTNFLRTKKVLVAPIYGTKIDHVALNKLQSVFRGTRIVTLDCTHLAREGGVLNCISASFCSPTQTSDR